jgi:two-component system, NtrC family, response regulator GlrR
MAAPTVLVVDDDKLTRFSVSRILGRAGYHVREAGSAEEGMTAIEVERPALVLLDIRLPGKDGFAVLRAIRKSHPQLPVVMITAHHTEETARKAKAHGAWAYLVKPCNAAELQSVVSTALHTGPEPGSVTG